MKETNLVGWSFGLERLPDNPNGLTHRLVFVDAPAAANGSILPGAELRETISVMLDADAVAALRKQLDDTLAEKPIEIAQGLPANRKMLREIRRANRR